MAYYTYHHHGGVGVRTRSLSAWIYEAGPRTMRKRTRPRVWGRWCPVCGFEPNERAKEVTVAAVKRVNAPFKARSIDDEWYE
jgi:hypothetical protein